MSDFTQTLNADITDPSDVVLWLGNAFAGNVGHRVSDAGHIFDIDAALAVEIARRWNGFAALEAQIAAADRMASFGPEFTAALSRDGNIGLVADLRNALAAYHATKEPTA